MRRGADVMGSMWDFVAHPGRRHRAARVLLALLVLVLSALPLQRATISGAEETIFFSINGWPDWLAWLVVPIMQLGTFAAVPIVALVALFVFKRRRVAVDLALSGTAAWALARIVKAAVERGRPGDLLPDVIIRGPAATGYGYISGHTSVAVALATVAAAYLGLRGKFLVGVLAAVVGIGRIFVGAHFPLDVVGGAAMGWAVGSLVHFLVLPEIMQEGGVEETEE